MTVQITKVEGAYCYLRNVNIPVKLLGKVKTSFTVIEIVMSNQKEIQISQQ